MVFLRRACPRTPALPGLEESTTDVAKIHPPTRRHGSLALEGRFKPRNATAGERGESSPRSESTCRRLRADFVRRCNGMARRSADCLSQSDVDKVIESMENRAVFSATLHKGETMNVEKAEGELVIRLSGPVDSNLCDDEVWGPFCKPPAEKTPAGADAKKKKVSPKEETPPETK